MLFLEVVLSIHCLLLVSSWFIGRHWLVNQPSLKLKLVRILLVSCVISPCIVQCINPAEKPARIHSISLDALQEQVNQPILKSESFGLTDLSTRSIISGDFSYSQLFYVIFSLIIFMRGYRVLLDMRKVRSILNEAMLYRTSGKLVIKISDRCHVPFGVSFFNKAYIVLPLSLLSSAKNVKIAIAHEGQHHRNRDCLWAYFIELIRIVFFANPGVTEWRRVLSELQEYACDEVLVDQPNISAHEYGHCLFQVVQTVSQCSVAPKQEFACTVGMAMGKESLDTAFIIRRISMLSTYPLNPSKSVLFGVAIAGFSVLAPICVAYSAVGTLASSKGADIELSHLNPKMQKIAANEIATAIKQYHANSGVIAIADPITGHIIAFAEASKQKTQNSWKSRVFTPGSTIKPFIAAAAIDVGTSAESKIYDCHSPYHIDGKTFTNYKADFRSVSLADAIAKSVNTCLIKVAQDTGSVIIRKKLGEFGFDMNSGWQANQSDNLQLAKTAVGEDIPVTVTTLVKSFAILANKGHFYGENAGAAISEATANAVTHMLEKAVFEGTGINAAIQGVSIAGKTGTVSENVDFAKSKHLSLFAGYTADAPRYVMLVVIEDGYINKNGKRLASGGDLAAPVFRHVLMKSEGVYS